MNLRLTTGFDDLEFREAWQQYRANATDPRELWDEAVHYLAVEKGNATWRTEGAAQGTPWPAAGARSRRGRRIGGRGRVRRSAELMVLTGRLRRSLSAEKGTGGIRRKTRSELRFGTRVKTANLHQNGGRGRLPKRPVLVITREDERKQIELVRQHVFGATRRRGL